MKREFLELPGFLASWNKLGLTEDDLTDLEHELCCNPDAGDLIQGTGGLRKYRWNVGNKGKRGGVRVLYIDFVSYEKIYFLNVYTKNKKDSLSDNERNVIKKKIKELKRELENNK